MFHVVANVIGPTFGRIMPLLENLLFGMRTECNRWVGLLQRSMAWLIFRPGGRRPMSCDTENKKANGADNFKILVVAGSPPWSCSPFARRDLFRARPFYRLDWSAVFETQGAKQGDCCMLYNARGRKAPMEIKINGQYNEL